MVEKKKKNGFTFIELMIVAAVIAIVTALVLARYRSGERANALRLAVQQVIGDIREAQGMALSSQKFCVVGDHHECGVGVSFGDASKQSYVIFTDKNGDRWYDSEDDSGESIKTIFLPKGIEIFIPTVQVNMIFVPPRPDTYFLVGNEIALEAVGTGLIQHITVSFEGVIEYY